MHGSGLVSLRNTLLLQHKGLGLPEALGAVWASVSSYRHWCFLLSCTRCTALGNALATIASAHVALLTQ